MKRWNIESMADHLDVPNFFEWIYLVDLSPSLCKVARARFQRLGWENVSVICEDARFFAVPRPEMLQKSEMRQSADLITMSYSLSMIPGEHLVSMSMMIYQLMCLLDYYSVIDSVSLLLDHSGIIAVVDFYGICSGGVVDLSTDELCSTKHCRRVCAQLYWRCLQ